MGFGATAICRGGTLRKRQLLVVFSAARETRIANVKSFTFVGSEPEAMFATVLQTAVG